MAVWLGCLKAIINAQVQAWVGSNPLLTQLHLGPGSRDLGWHVILFGDSKRLASCGSNDWYLAAARLSYMGFAEQQAWVETEYKISECPVRVAVCSSPTRKQATRSRAKSAGLYFQSKYQGRLVLEPGFIRNIQSHVVCHNRYYNSPQKP